MMKWWGWGDEGKSFPMESKPTLWPWIEAKLDIHDRKKTSFISKDNITLNPPV